MDMQTLAAAVALSKGSGGGGSFAPDITDPQDGDTLVYNAAQQKWVNGAGGGGGTLVVHNQEGTFPPALDKTYAEIAAAAETSSVVLNISDEGTNIILRLVTYGENDGAYGVIFYSGFHQQADTYMTDSVSGYPVKI